MSRRQEMTGKKFGKWTVLSRTRRKQPNGKYTYLATCQCECGTIKDIVVNHLRNGRSRSCGCDKSRYDKVVGSKNKRFKGHKDIRGTIWSHIRNGALNRGIEFALGIEEAWALFEKQERKCALTGLAICFDKCRGDSTASLDRIDSSKGYTIDNVQWVHKDVNIMKNRYGMEYFVEICRLVTTNQTA